MLYVHGISPTRPGGFPRPNLVDRFILLDISRVGQSRRLGKIAESRYHHVLRPGLCTYVYAFIHAHVHVHACQLI